MKKIFLTTIACSCLFSAFAQDSLRLKTPDQQLPRLCLDVNYMEGALSQIITMAKLDVKNIYGANGIITNAPVPKFTSGHSRGGDISLGYFLGHSRVFGVGLGFSYFSQSGNMNMDSFHVEYERRDTFGSQYRQIIRSNKGLTDNVTVSNISIPVMVKFKHQFRNNLGVTADFGGLVNISSTSKYKTNASFDYEAAYLRSSDGSYTYDPNPTTFNPNDWLITRENYKAHNPQGGETGVTEYFDQKYTNGFNVKLANAINTNTHTTKYTQPINLGLIARLALSYKLHYRVTVDLGGYYSYMSFKNASNDKLTDRVGQYNGMSALVSHSNVQSYGINVGLRFFFGGFPDMDGDGIADAKDKCPYDAGLAQFYGCPDTDGDGVPDKEDRCPTEKGSKLTAGCPDRDDDGVPDDVDRCPDEPGTFATGGCPDRDHDGIADDIDLCPDVPGLKIYHGCPTDSTLRTTLAPTQSGPVPNCKPTHIELSNSVINFKTGKADIEATNYGILNEVLEDLKKDGTIIVYISGHTDDIGTYQNNLMLSFARAESVQKYLIAKGVPKAKIFISGMGKTEPIIKNDSPENRAKNRRIEIHLLQPVSN